MNLPEGVTKVKAIGKGNETHNIQFKADQGASHHRSLSKSRLGGQTALDLPRNSHLMPPQPAHLGGTIKNTNCHQKLNLWKCRGKPDKNKTGRKTKGPWTAERGRTDAGGRTKKQPSGRLDKKKAGGEGGLLAQNDRQQKYTMPSTHSALGALK